MTPCASQISRPPVRSARLFVVTYCVALFMIATLSVSIHVAGKAKIAAQQRDAEIINVAGRQRMLSQRIAFLRLSLQGGADPSLIEELETALAVMEDSHAALTKGRLRWAPGSEEASALGALYFGTGRLDARVGDYLREARLALGAARDGGAAPRMAAPPSELLASLNRAVGLHERAASGRVSAIHSFSRNALLALLALLGFEAMIVFGPAVRRLVRIERELAVMASTDPLTGCHNRRSLFSAASSIISLNARRSEPVAVVAVDIDHFKRVNDDHGHAVGDRAIRHVVDVIRGSIRASDQFGRIGGEEFVIVCPGADTLGGAQVAEKVRQALAETPMTLPGGETLSLTASFGVHAERVTPRSVLDDLLIRADRALYAAKRGGRNRVVTDEDASDASRASYPLPLQAGLAVPAEM